jgi:uncharacterized protein (DUF1501 family)
MGPTRRYFLKSAGLSLFGAGLVPTFLRRTALALDQPSFGARKKILVAVFQRGAADGLNVVVPFGEKEYYSLRPTISIPQPASGVGEGGTALDLDGFFGLHPSLAPLHPIFMARHLAVVHATGSPDNTRSHFDAQDYMESATPGVKSTEDGWLNRYLRLDPELDPTPFRAVAFAPRMPRTLLGPAPALAIDDLRAFCLPGNGGTSNRPNLTRLPCGPNGFIRPAGPAAGFDGSFEAMYASTSDPLLASTAREMFAATSMLEQIGAGDYRPEEGAEYPTGPLGRSLQQVAQLIKANVGLELGFAEVGGWDHHVNEGGVQGQLAGSLTQFAAALAAFYRDMGDRMADVVVLTMSEFGRTARENGNWGTDHGHANAMFALGGPVKDGKVYGKWPGLKPDQLYEGRDLALTIDFRDVFAEVLVRHLGARDASGIFPGFTVSADRFRGFLA